MRVVSSVRVVCSVASPGVRWLSRLPLRPAAAALVRLETDLKAGEVFFVVDFVQNLTAVKLNVVSLLLVARASRSSIVANSASVRIMSLIDFDNRDRHDTRTCTHTHTHTHTHTQSGVTDPGGRCLSRYRIYWQLPLSLFK